jgi:tetratricopeptide (TPR) repeat protein
MSYIQMAAIYYEQKQWDQMIDVSQRAVSSDANNPLGHLQLGVAYYRKGADEGANAAHFYHLAKHSFLSVAPLVGDEQYPYFLYLARISDVQGDKETALNAYRMLAKTSPSVEHLRESANFLMSIQRPEESMPIYEQILSQTSLTPEVVSVWIEAAEAYMVVGAAGRACELLDEALTLCNTGQCRLDNLANITNITGVNCPN